MFTARQPKDAIIRDFAAFVSPGKARMYQAMGLPLVPGKREGCYMWDVDGQRLLNCRSSGGVFNLGHRPPRVVAALRAALDELDIGDHILISEQRTMLAKRLATLLPGDLELCVFTASGGEAIDVAIKLARGVTKRPGIVSTQGGFHGHTGLGLAAGDDKYKAPFEPLAPGFSQVPFGDREAMAQAVTDDTAAVLLETIPATAGILIPSPDYLPRLREICDRAGALLILDEVQAGLGRTGRLWAFEEWGIVPDVVVLGKGLSGGIYPLAAACYRARWQGFFMAHPFIHSSSFGGADLGCVAALAMLEQVTAPGFLEHVRDMGALLGRELARLQGKHSGVVLGVRQRGLMVGLQTSDERFGPLLTSLLGQNGILALYANNRPSTLIIMPPLIIEPRQIGEVIAALDVSLAALPG